MTGTEDKSPVQQHVGYEERLEVYASLPKGDKYRYVFAGGKHNRFSGPTKLRPRLLRQHEIIQRLSLWFFQKHLRNDLEATGSLEQWKAVGNDVWEMK